MFAVRGGYLGIGDASKIVVCVSRNQCPKIHQSTASCLDSDSVVLSVCTTVLGDRLRDRLCDRLRDDGGRLQGICICIHHCFDDLYTDHANNGRVLFCGESSIIKTWYSSLDRYCLNSIISTPFARQLIVAVSRVSWLCSCPHICGDVPRTTAKQAR